MSDRTSYFRLATLRDGTPVVIRSIRRDDAGLLAAHFAALSAEASYRRFFGLRHAIASHELDRLTAPEYPHHIALIAIVTDTTGAPVIVGDARAVATDHSGEAELAISVLDAYQGLGVGSILVRHLSRCAREAGFDRVTTDTLASNAPAIRMLVRSGFTSIARSDGILTFVHTLAPDTMAEPRDSAGAISPAVPIRPGAS
jgi:ribosomal protein S18 acetylase RimI-like enzyme